MIFGFFSRVEDFDNWLTLLPEFLCQPKVPYHLVKALSNVARYNLPQFTKSLYMLKPAILGDYLKLFHFYLV